MRMDANMLLAWHKYGGGKELLEKLYASIGANVVSFPYGPMPTQPLGWFKKPITKVEDFKGLKFRTVGISIDVFQAMGAAVNALPGGEIVSAMDRGLLDAAEFNNASSDRILGFADVSKVCMLQSYHQNAEQFEIMFNKDKYNALPEKMRAIIANAVEAASAGHVLEGDRPLFKDYVELQTKDNVKFYKTPDADPEAAARGLRRGRGEEGGGKSAVQGDRANRSSRSPSARRSGSRTRWSAARWRSTTTSAPTARQADLKQDRSGQGTIRSIAGWCLVLSTSRYPRRSSHSRRRLT